MSVHFQGYNQSYDRTMDMYDPEAIRGFTKRPQTSSILKKKVFKVHCYAVNLFENFLIQYKQKKVKIVRLNVYLV